MEKIDPRHLLVKVAEILQKLKIPYMVTGGMAVFVWGRPRFTADIDIIVELDLATAGNLIPVLRSLSEVSYIDEDAVENAIKNFGEFNFIDGESGMKVDFWVLKDNSFDISRIKRRIPKKILGEKIYFISSEDLILSKLEWYQKSQSSRHLEDIDSIIKISGKKLDMKYLRKWAEALEIKNILDKLLRQREKA